MPKGLKIMRAYQKIAEETNTSVEDVRMAVLFARKRETPYTVEYNDFSHSVNDNLNEGPSRYGRAGIKFETWWEVYDFDTQSRYVGNTREEAIINALSAGFRA